MVLFATLLAEPDEGSRVLSLVDIVENSPGPMGYTVFIKKAVAGGVYADLRRMGTWGVKMLQEHNYYCWCEMDEAYQKNKGVAQDAQRFKDFVEFTAPVDADKLPPL